MAVHLALYQPDIPQNTAAIMRTAACLDVPLHIIEPCGFPLSDARMRRAGMDYLDQVDLIRHASWAAFTLALPGARRILLTTKGDTRLPAFRFQADDVLLFGRESVGVPDEVHTCAQARVKIPLKAKTRSLNLAQSVALVAGLALGQLDAFPA